MKPKLTIAIISYNNGNVIEEAIKSAISQDYPLKEIIVMDDCSTDDTISRCMKYPVRFISNPENIGIGRNLQRAMEKANGKYVLYLCADDIFVSNKVASDVVGIFNRHPRIGVIGRYYYYFLHGKKGAIGTCRDGRIIINSCCPSGIALRNVPVVGSNKIFIEMPLIVNQVLKDYDWTMLEYDTVGARYNPGENTGTKESYYTESPLENWRSLCGDDFVDYPSFIMLKNRAPKILWREICLTVKGNKSALTDMKFWINALISLLMPAMVLRKLSLIYRDTIGRKNAVIIERSNSV